MDFTDSPTEAAFRDEARAWLSANAGPYQRPQGEAWPGLDEDLKRAKAWQTHKAESGYACLTWPREWGGGGRTSMEQVIFGQEEAKYGLAAGYFSIGLGMCIPTVMAVADEETKQRFLPKSIRGEEIWCQLFSEPGAGSDVAASRTRAVRDGDDWIIDGQKVWTSGAHYSNYGLLLVRTNPELPKHKGLTMFWVDMSDPAIEVRPIHQISGGSDFNEVYFTGLRVSDSQRLGEIGRGWNVALITLMNERLAVGGGSGVDWADLLALARDTPGLDREHSVLQDGGFREKLANWYVNAEGLRYTRLRTMTALSRGETPGPEASIGKVVSARQTQEIASEALDRLGQYGIVADSSLVSSMGAFQNSWFWGAAMRIAGGTDEILKNIIAERVLGLPGDIRVDRDIPFKDLVRGA